MGFWVYLRLANAADQKMVKRWFQVCPLLIDDARLDIIILSHEIDKTEKNRPNIFNVFELIKSSCYIDNVSDKLVHIKVISLK